jgi:hypothetical protein
MYNTVKEVHIAIDTELQQLSSNRKQTFHPEQYDMIINTSILKYIDDKISPKTNTKQEGFEDTQIRLDELKALKRNISLRCYNDSINKKYIILPSNYLHLIENDCEITSHYNKRNLNISNNTETKYVYKINFSNDNNTIPNDTLYKSCVIYSPGLFTISYNKSIYSKLGKFEIINYFLDVLNKQYNFDVYWEWYNNIYEANRFIIVSNTQLTNPIILTFVSNNTTITNNSSLTQVIYNYSDSTENIITSPIELVSSKDKNNILYNSFYNTNRYKKPICTLDTDKLNIYFDKYFNPLRINLSYLIKPRPINYYYNIMPEIKINEEIIKLSVNRIKTYIKDEEGYNMFLQQMNKINN